MSAMDPGLLRWFTVYGYWAQTGERFGGYYTATSPRAAEDQAQLGAVEASGQKGALRICRVTEGQLTPADQYTLFLDPQDPRNDDADGLTPDTPDYTRGDPDWTVFGLAVPAGIEPGDPQIAFRGERYGDVVAATSPLGAEDVARDRLKPDGQLLVCAVLPGQVRACDTYATFADPDVAAERR